MSLKPWHQQLMEMLETDPHPTKVHWFWGESGVVTHKVCDAILQKYPTTSVLLPKRGLLSSYFQVFSSETSHFPILTHIKDGKISLYPNQLIADNPHVIVLADCDPDYEALSQHKWNVLKIRELGNVLSI